MRLLSSSLASLSAIVLALGAVESLAWWWMHPTPTGHAQPVLCYRPGASRSAGVPPASESAPSKPAPSFEPELSQNPATVTDRRYNPTDNSSSFTPLPEIYAQAAPMLRCSRGQVFHVKSNDALDLHVAFFEWDDTDTGSVLEAFRHIPEACLGSLGMILLSKQPPLIYQVGTETLIFDHTIFREPGSAGGLTNIDAQVHAFRAVWVAGMSDANARKGLAGDSSDRLRSIRLKSALTRFRPAHARVVQGAVRGAANADSAWQAFQTAMLVDLTTEKQ